MNTDRWDLVQSVFTEALGKAPEARPAYLKERCGADIGLRSEVESLLQASDSGASFFGHLKGKIDALSPPHSPQGPPANLAGIRGALDRSIGERYRVEALLAEGGMGLVFLAVDRKHGRQVAIKTVLPSADSDLIARFQREIRITARLQHPNILPLLDSGLAEGVLFFIMPYVDGETLKARLDRIGRLPPGVAVALAIEIASGLAYAHGRGVLHRDVKPSNVLLADDRVQMVDFGVARVTVDLGDANRTAAGLAVGTPNYMAPEQFAGEATPQSDVYALGAVLYEALTGRVWRAENALGEASWEHVPEGLAPLLRTALAPLPADRWASASHLGNALRGWAQGAPSAKGSGEKKGTIIEQIAARWRGRRGRIPLKSIAVLPFGSLSDDQEAEYFAEGMTDDIIAHLSRISDLKVISRTSSMRFKDHSASVSRIARKLGVATILEGSVRRSGDRIRVVAQLIDGATDGPLWTETFDREVTDVFAIQSEIAQRIASALRARISSAERSVIQHRPTEDVEAHDLYLKGRHLWNRRNQTALTAAEEHFSRAVARDPLFAPAYAGLADAHLMLGGYGFTDEVASLHKAQAAADRALALNDRLPQAFASRGQILRAHRDWAGEETSYRRAIELNPNYATAHQWYSTLLAALDRPREALREVDRAVELDPLSHAIGVTSGIVRFLQRDYDGALSEFDRTLRLEPRFFSAYAWLMILWGHLGEFERGFRAFGTLHQLHGDPRMALYAGAYLHALAGERDKALAVLHDPRGRGPELGWAGLVYTQLGEYDRAFEELETTLADPSWRMFVLQRNLLFYMQVGPWFDPIRTDPRYGRLLRLMRFDGDKPDPGAG